MRVWHVLLLGLLSACSQTRFVSKPIDSQENLQKIHASHPDQEGFKHYLAQQSPHTRWPVLQWDLQALSLSAWYFHPSLKVAKSDYAVALAAITQAGLRPQIGLNGLLSRSNQANGDINPFLYTLQFDIPVITNGKREINIEIARYQADMAKIQLSETAWQLRIQLATDALDRAEQLAMQANWQQLQHAQSELLNAYQKRLDAGMSGRAELLPIQLQYEQSQWQLSHSHIAVKQVEQKIVHDAGLTDSNLVDANPNLADSNKGEANLNPLQFNLPALRFLLDTQIKPAIQQSDSPLLSSRQLQAYAMTNRMDIQRGLAQYAQAEAKLKLEIAKLKPDISLNPGVAYEFGDQIWSLGIGGLLNLLNPASTLWQQADAVRSNEADRFYALQHKLVQQCEQQTLAFRQAYHLLTQLENEEAQYPQRLRTLEQQWKSGLIDKTEWLQSQIQFYSLRQRLISQQATVLRAALEIENTMQVPLLFTAPALPSAVSLTGEQK
jgi:outer membrane protein, heavy metal efflux system